MDKIPWTDYQGLNNLRQQLYCNARFAAGSPYRWEAQFTDVSTSYKFDNMLTEKKLANGKITESTHKVFRVWKKTFTCAATQIRTVACKLTS